MTLLEVAEKFPTEEAAKEWLESQFWPNGPFCPDCGSLNVQCDIKHNTMTHRCRDCPERPMFTLRKGTVMEGTKLKYRLWAIAIYLFLTNLKGISSKKLQRELGIGRRAAWFMLHRIREAANIKPEKFVGPVEVDETYIGGKRDRMRYSRYIKMEGRGPKGKTAIIGIKDRATGQVVSKVFRDVNKVDVQKFILDHVEPGAKIYTDQAKIYQGLPNHEAITHKLFQYVRGDAHTNGIESHWASIKRGYKGVYHNMSPKHLDRYAKEYSHRNNVRKLDTIDQMNTLVMGMRLKRLKYQELIADNGLESFARNTA